MPGKLIPLKGMPNKTIQEPGLAVLALKSKVSFVPTQSKTLSYRPSTIPAPNLLPASF